MTLEQDIDHGVRVEKLLNDADLKGAFDEVAVAIHQRWEECPLRDKDGAHELRLMLRALNDVRANLAMALEHGKLAANELKLKQQAESPAEFDRRWRKSDYGY